MGQMTALVTGASGGIGAAICHALAERGARIIPALPEEVAQVVTFCALDAPASMTGAIVDVNGASYLRT